MNKGGVKKRFRDMKLTGKMVVIYLLAGLVPVMIILGITYMEMKKDPVGPGDNDLGILCQPDHGFHGQ